MFRRSTTIVFLSSLATLLTACGGGSSDSPPATGEVAVILTDGPTDLYDRVLVSITEFTLIGPGGHVDLYNGPAITFDLLEMSEWGDLAFNTKVLAGQYNKIRLQLSSIVLEDTETGAMENITPLPAGGKIDLNPQGPFEVSPDYTTVIKLDMDAERSFQVVQTGSSKLKLRPIFFVDVFEGNIFLPERLVRVFGTVDYEVTSTDPVDSFRLCGIGFVSQVGGSSAIDPGQCVRVYTDDTVPGGTGIFNESGMASDFSAISSPAVAPIQATAIGFITDTDDSTSFLGLEAVTVGIGDRGSDPGHWDTVFGTVADDPGSCGTNCFTLDTAGSSISTYLEPGVTRVFSADGTDLTPANVISMGDVGSVDAFRTPAGDLNAALIVLSINDSSGVVTGILNSISTPSMSDPYTQLAVGQDGGGELVVCVDDHTNIVQVLADDEVVTLFDIVELDGAAIETGLVIEAYGETAPITSMTCNIIADQLIIEPAPAP